MGLVILDAANAVVHAAPLAEGECRATKEVVDQLRIEQQHAAIYGNSIEVPTNALKNEIQIGGEPSTLEKMLRIRNVLDTPDGYRRTVSLYGEGRQARERVDGIKLLLEGKFYENAKRESGRLVVFTAGDESTYGYILQGDKPLGVKPTKYCVLYVVSTITLRNSNADGFPTALARNGAVYDRVRFVNTYGYAPAYWAHRNGGLFVLTMGPSHLGSLYAGDEGLTARVLNLEQLEYGQTTMGCCRFRGHPVKVESEIGGWQWLPEGSSVGSSSLRQ